MTSGDARGDDTPSDRDERQARRRSPDAEEGARRSAPVLSLEERKAQRLRDREAARAARIAALVASEDESGERGLRAKAERRARAAREAAEAEGAAPHGPADGSGVEGPVAEDAPDGQRRAAPALGGVRPGEGLGAEAAPVGRAAPLGSALAPPGEAPLREGRPLQAPASAPATAPAAAPAKAAKPAGLAKPRGRHWGVALSFVVVVILPTLVAAWYLWERATPRFASYAGFTVRTEETASAVELLGGMASLGGSNTSSDSAILYEFIQSQDIVERVDERLDLRALWAKGNADRDPIFAYRAPGTIEDLHDYWMRMVSVYTDGASGLLDIEVQAFAPEDAQAIAQAIYDEGTILINRLSDDAQEQATRYAEEELEASVDRLKVARAALTRFRNETQIVDPATAVQSQMGLLSQLEAELAQTLIDLDLLRQTAPDGDPRITQGEARVEVIEARMAAEREKLGLGRSAAEGADDGTAFADLVGEYEGLVVDQQFAEQAYTAALTAYDSALAESRRQSRYLAAHVSPTLAQRAVAPAEVELTLLAALFAFLLWAILTLAAYALRDRR